MHTWKPGYMHTYMRAYTFFHQLLLPTLCAFGLGAGGEAGHVTSHRKADHDCWRARAHRFTRWYRTVTRCVGA